MQGVVVQTCTKYFPVNQKREEKQRKKKENEDFEMTPG